jgi:hypothetical protein
MIPRKDKKLILSLIRDDLINSKLTIGLSALDLDPTIYFLHLSETIFMLMGIKEDKQGEELFEYYLELKQKIKAIDFTKSYKALDRLALNIYTKLSKGKRA